MTADDLLSGDGLARAISFMRDFRADLLLPINEQFACLRIPVESGHDSDGKASTVPAGIRPAFRFDSVHHSGAIRPM
jgi:hypothetical protein